MRILFWNTHRNVDINSYILDIVNQNEIDVLVLAAVSYTHLDVYKRQEYRNIYYQI